ncbi:MAG: hypothetical protein ACI8Y7_000177 [Candidatus Woesearchaeota archaeon]|jgi:hypothetical protein
MGFLFFGKKKEEPKGPVLKSERELFDLIHKFVPEYFNQMTKTSDIKIIYEIKRDEESLRSETIKIPLTSNVWYQELMQEAGAQKEEVKHLLRGKYNSILDNLLIGIERRRKHILTRIIPEYQRSFPAAHVIPPTTTADELVSLIPIITVEGDETGILAILKTDLEDTRVELPAALKLRDAFTVLFLN